MRTGTREVSIGFVSTYPPTVCGLATYTHSLLNAIAGDRRSRSGLGVVALAASFEGTATSDMAFRHRTGNASSLEKAAHVLNSFDTVSIQHEFGIFGGADGDEVLDLVSRLTVPTAITFHTVLDEPTRHQREITDRLSAAASRIVVMSRTAALRLGDRYGIDPDLIEVIPHGADQRFSGPSLVTGDRPLALTWGLIGPGKGLESAIAAFAHLADLDPRPRYLIAGATHPHIRHASGESYRHSLVSLVHDHGVEDMVEFDDRYLDQASLARMVRSADLVVLPYESVEQVTSGVLVEAIAASKPVVATRFPHAVELLSDGAGITVPHSDTGALAGALRLLMTDRTLTSRMAMEARRLADGWFWPTIGRRYEAMLSGLATAAGAAAPRTTEVLHRVAG